MRCAPIHCALDPVTHHRDAPYPHWTSALSLLANRSADRERRIEELQRQLGGHLQPQRRNPWDRSQDDYTDRRQQQGGLGGGGGGFLAGAAQTALGVAGGVLLGNMIGGLCSSTPTQAEEFDPGQDQQDQNLDAGQDDGGNDDDMFGGFDTGGDF